MRVICFFDCLPFGRAAIPAATASPTAGQESTGKAAFYGPCKIRDAGRRPNRPPGGFSGRGPRGPAAAGGAAGGSGRELAVGAVCRRVLHTAVWDYADEWGNLAGLVCPKYTAYWFLLCGWVIFVLRGVESTVYHPQKSASRH